MPWRQRFMQACRNAARLLKFDIIRLEPFRPEWAGQFEERSKELTSAGLKVILIVMNLLNVLTWPVDFLLYDAASQEFQIALYWRVWLMICSVLMLILLRSFPSRPFLVVVLTVAVCTGGTGWLLGSVDDLHHPFKFVIYTIPFLTIFLAVKLPARVGTVALFVYAYFGCFFLAGPAHLSLPHMDVVILHAFDASFAAIVAGHFFYVLLRANYFQRRRLDQLSGQLQERVDEQTHEIRHLADGISSIQERERTRIAHDLHDEMGQRLVGLGLEFQLAGRNADKLGPDAAPVRRSLDRALEQIHGLHDSLDEVIHALCPRALEGEGIDNAIRKMVQDLAQRSGIAAEVEMAMDAEAFPHETSIVVYRIVQEAVTNVARHSRAGRVRIELHPVGDGVRLRITDNGVGFDPARVEGKVRTGLRGIRERSRLLKGVCTITSRKGQGCSIEITFPHGALGREASA